MPKVQLSVAQRMREFPTDSFINENEKLFCTLCNVYVRYERKSIVHLHTRSAKHLKRKTKLEKIDVGGGGDEGMVEDMMTEEDLPQGSGAAGTSSNSTSKETLSRVSVTVKTLRENTSKMISVFSEVGIPLDVFKNKTFRQWVAKDTCVKRPPTESGVKKYLGESGVNDTELTKKKCRERDVFVIIDESTDLKSYKLVNILVGPLGFVDSESERARLVTSKIVDRCTADVLVDLVLDAINNIEVSRNNLLCLLSYNAPYMQDVTDRLSGVCKRLLHSTCWSHVLRLCSEEIRSTLKFADRFVACVTSALTAVPARKEFLLDCLVKEGLVPKLPPALVVTRWKTWLQAVKYHSENYNAIKCWIHEEDHESSADMMELATLVTDVNQPVLTSQLHSVARVADAICAKIKVLECRKVDASQVWLHLNNLLELVQICCVPCKTLMAYLGGRHTAYQFWSQVQVLDPTRASQDPFLNGIPRELLRFADINVSQAALAHEWAQYKVMLQEDNQRAIVSTLSFWKRNKSRMPHLSNLASKALTVPACSSAFERRFSTLSWLLSRKSSFTKSNVLIQLRLAYNAVDDHPQQESDESDVESIESKPNMSYFNHD